jgi:prevent-host-death family protein
MCTLLRVEEIGTRELRANLAAAVRQAAAGDRVVITLDGRPVAQLGPIEPAGPPTLTELAAAGLVEPPRRPDRPPAPDAVDAAVDVRLDRVLAEVRGG